MKSPFAALLVAAVLSSQPLPASAQQEADGRAEFDRGRAAFDAGRFDEALTAFRSSLELLPSPNSRLMVARALVGLTRLVEAREEMRRAEREAAERAPTEPRYRDTQLAAQTEGAEIEQSVARVRLHVAGEPLDALTVRVAVDAAHTDERRVEMTEGLFWVAPGPTFVTIEASDGRTARADFVAAAGDVHELVLALPAPAPPAPEPEPIVVSVAPEPEPLPPVDTSSHASAFAPVGWISLGVGAASLIAFGALYAATDSAFSSLSARCGMVGCTDADLSEAQTYATLTNVFFVAGLVLVPVGIAGLIAAQIDAGSVTFALGPSSASMRVVF